MQPETIPCVICGKPVKKARAGGYQRGTCSEACRHKLQGIRWAAHPVKATKTCAQCGKTFTPWKPSSDYCSHTCANNARMVFKPTICIICGKEFLKSKRWRRDTCSEECHILARRRGNPGNHVYGGGKDLDKYGKGHVLKTVEAGLFPLPVDPQWQPFTWRDIADAA